MGLPTHIVEAAFAGDASTGTVLHLDDTARGLLGTATLAAGITWQDITPYVHRFSVTRGANRVTGPVIRYEAGTAVIELNNSDRRFDPTNLDGPYVSAGVTQVTPMRAIRIRETWDGLTYDLFRGFADGWKIDYTPPNYSLCVLSCTDAEQVLANYDRNAVAAVGAGENAGTRVNRILDSVGWSSVDRLVNTGNTTLQATTLADNTWTELLLTQDTEIGEVYVDEAGRVVFRNRHAAMSEIRSTSTTACFGDNPAANPVTAVNYFTNPSAETTTDGYSPAGSPAPTVARSNTRAKSGTWSIKTTWAGGDVFIPSLWITAPTGVLTVGQPYTWSAWVYIPTGSPDIQVFDVSVTLGTVVTVKDTWTRVTQSFVYTGATILGMAAIGGGDAGDELFVDSVMITDNGTATLPDYFDGDSAAGEWDGTAHASTSRLLPELRYADVEVDYDADTLRNLVQVARAGGTQQSAEDAASRQLNLTRTHTRTDLLMQTDAVALEYAKFILYQAKNPELRFSTLHLMPQRDEDRLFPQVLGRRFGDRIRIIRRPPGGGDPIVREVFIRGVEHIVEKDSWSTTWALQSATKWSFLVLDHTTLGVLDANALAY